MIGVVVPQGRHGEDGPGVDVHGDGPRAVERVVIQHRLAQMLFDIVLDARVDGGKEILPVLSGAVLLIASQQHLSPVGVGGAQAPARRAGEGVVIAGLDALEPVVVRAHKAQQMAGEAAVGVIAPGVGLEADAADMVFGLESSDLGGLVGFDLARRGHIPAPLASGLLVELVIVKAEDFRKTPGDQFPVLAVGLDLGRAQIDVVHRGADREDVPVAVVDPPARRRAGGLAQLLGDGQVFVKRVIRNLQLVKPRQ